MDASQEHLHHFSHFFHHLFGLPDTRDIHGHRDPRSLRYNDSLCTATAVVGAYYSDMDADHHGLPNTGRVYCHFGAGSMPYHCGYCSTGTTVAGNHCRLRDHHH